MDNPLNDIEDKTAQYDLGVMACRAFLGSLSECNSMFVAYFATSALFHGMFKNLPEDEDDTTN